MLLHAPGLLSLPVELLYEIQLYALSPFLPYSNHHLIYTFKQSPISFRVQYLLAACTKTNETPFRVADILSKALRFSLCTSPVLDSLLTKLDALSRSNPTLIESYDQAPHICELPRRLFRSLGPRNGDRDWEVGDEPLPFLRHILNKGTQFPGLDPNSYQGYALTRAVHARHMPLIQFLLDMGASPVCKDGMAVKVAIRQKNLGVVRMLVERAERHRSVACTTLEREGGRQKQKGGKRVQEESSDVVDRSMLKLAVKCNARDIIDYLAWEKGVVPDMQTLNSLRP